MGVDFYYFLVFFAWWTMEQPLSCVYFLTTGLCAVWLALYCNFPLLMTFVPALAIPLSHLSQDHLASINHRSRALGRYPEKELLLFWILSKLPPPAPSPQFGQLVPLFFNANWPKNLGRGSPSLPIPKLTQYIQFVKSGQKIWAGPSGKITLYWNRKE